MSEHLITPPGGGNGPRLPDLSMLLAPESGLRNWQLAHGVARPIRDPLDYSGRTEELAINFAGYGGRVILGTVGGEILIWQGRRSTPTTFCGMYRVSYYIPRSGGRTVVYCSRLAELLHLLWSLARCPWV